MDGHACFTLKTRVAYYYLKSAGKYEIYVSYLKGEITRDELYSHIPVRQMDSVINLPIGKEHNAVIHHRIANQLGKKEVDLIIGGPPCQAYSVAGRARDRNKMQDDSRNWLYQEYARYLEKYQPRLFVFEMCLALNLRRRNIPS